jgi:uncharacterized membrane protein YeaQ/YmgE (transglycosylase-associated protein family)
MKEIPSSVSGLRRALELWPYLFIAVSITGLSDSSVHISVRPFQADPRRIIMGFLVWIVVGLIAGWLAGQVMKGGGYGILVDIILGILGGFLGGWIFGLLGIWQGGGMIGSIVVAFVGAVILVWITRVLKKA